MHAICVLLLAWKAQRASSFLCEGHCGVPDSLSFCDSISYSSCLFPNVDQEFVAQQQIIELENRFPAIRNVSEECTDIIRAYRCSVMFSACESIGDRASLLCASECAKVETLCHELPHDTVTAVCAATTDNREDESSCFGLDYEGPSFFLWAIGVALAATCSLFNSLAINLQKLSLNRTPGFSVLRQPLWLLGFVLLLLGTIMDFVAFGLAPQSLLAPLAALTLVFNMIVIPCFLKERLDLHNVVATAVIFTGATVTVAFSSHVTPHYTLADLNGFYHSTAMAWYAVLVPLLVWGCFAGVHYSEGRRYDLAAQHSKRGGGKAEEGEERAPQLRRLALLTRIHLLGCAGGAGIAGGQSVLFAKSVVELVKSVVLGHGGSMWRLLSQGETYMLLSALVTCLVLQIKYLNRGLRNHEALSLVPVYQACWILSSVIGGFVYFEEVKTLSQLRLSMFFVGIGVTIAGVCMLARRRQGRSGTNFAQGGAPRLGEDAIANANVDVGGGSTAGSTRVMRRSASSFAVNAYLQATPLLGAADILLEMGVSASKVSKLLTGGHTPLRSEDSVVECPTGGNTKDLIDSQRHQVLSPFAGNSKAMEPYANPFDEGAGGELIEI